MARRIFPNGEDRLIYGYTNGGAALTSKSGSTVTIYADSACTVLADIRTEAGGAIAGSVLAVGSDSRIPRFQGPDGTPYGVDTLYALVQGNVAPGEPIYARIDDRLDTDTFIRCTSSTHPTAPIDDQLIYESDTNKFLRWDTATSLWLSVNKKYPTDIVGVTANSAAITAETTIATSSVLAADGVTRFDIKGTWAGFTSTVATDQATYALYEDGVQIARVNRYSQSTAAGGGDGGTVERVGYLPAAGNHTYTLRLARAVGTGTVTNIAAATLPTQIVVKEA